MELSLNFILEKPNKPCTYTRAQMNGGCSFTKLFVQNAFLTKIKYMSFPIRFLKLSDAAKTWVHPHSSRPQGASPSAATLWYDETRRQPQPTEQETRWCKTPEQYQEVSINNFRSENQSFSVRNNLFLCLITVIDEFFRWFMFWIVMEKEHSGLKIS